MALSFNYCDECRVLTNEEQLKPALFYPETYPQGPIHALSLCLGCYDKIMKAGYTWCGGVKLFRDNPTWWI